jgi:hypothetical protein
MFIVSFFNFSKFVFQTIEVVLFFKSTDFHMVLIVGFLSIHLYLGRVNRP